jgi:hypothetical protein
MTMPMDNGDAGESMADSVAAEMDRHGQAMNDILSEHGVAPDDGDGEGSQPD